MLVATLRVPGSCHQGCETGRCNPALFFRWCLPAIAFVRTGTIQKLASFQARLRKDPVRNQQRLNPFPLTLSQSGFLSRTLAWLLSVSQTPIPASCVIGQSQRFAAGWNFIDKLKQRFFVKWDIQIPLSHSAKQIANLCFV